MSRVNSSDLPMQLRGVHQVGLPSRGPQLGSTYRLGQRERVSSRNRPIERRAHLVQNQILLVSLNHFQDRVIIVDPGRSTNDPWKTARLQARLKEIRYRAHRRELLASASWDTRCLPLLYSLA